MQFHPVYFVDRPLRHGDSVDDAVAKRNFDLCRAVNVNALGVVLDGLVEAGMPKEQAECFRGQAYALLQLMRTENNRTRLSAK